MDPSVQKIINAAKRYAIGADAQVLGFDEILVALAVLRDDKTIVNGVAKALGIKAVKWPAELLTKAEVAIAVDDQQVQGRQFVLESRFKDVFNALRRDGGSVNLETFLSAVLLAPEARECPAVQEFLDSHQTPSKKKRRVGLLGKLDEFERRRSRLEALLAEKVIGQDEAIRALGQGYLYSLREPREHGLRGIFTFLGPPGVGKTLLAEEFARALNEVEKETGGQAYEAHTFAMNASDDKGMKIQLFGTSSQWSNGKPGMLHDLINGVDGDKTKSEANARRVFVFDELEKAGEETIQSMLTLLSKGGFNDNFQQAFVDASQCFVIFTTNLGQEFFSSANQSGLLRGARFSSDQIFDLLATAKRRTQVNADEAPPALSPEFVDRLRQGAAVLFNRLSIGDYARIMDAIFAADAGGKQLLPRVLVSEEAKRLLILSLLPDLSARSLINQARRLKHRWTDEVLRLELPELQNQRSEYFNIDVTQKLDSASTELLNKLVTSKPVKVLVVDNDERMTRFVEDYGKSPDRQIKVEARRIKPGEAVEEILKSRPDLVLLDLDLPANQLPSGEIKALHRQIRETAPTVRLWLFGEERGEDFDFSELVEQGGARGYFSFEKDTQDIVLSEDHQARFQQVLEEVVFDRVMFELERSRRRLSPDFTFRDCKADDAEPTVGVEVTSLRSEQNVSLVTSPGQIAPGEKPDVTFDDVFGLERAKERLRDAIEMLKDPGRLSKFGVKAPCGYLLAGPPGTGKTHLARAAANAADCVFFPISCGELESKWIGETEERIRQLFQDARKYAPAVIFIDEIDAIAGKRNGASGTTHQPYVKALNQLLACMDGFAAAKGQILVLAATNRPEALDPAIKRPGRFDETIPIDLPKGAAREQMLRGLLAKKPCEPNVLDAIPRLVSQTAGFSPAELNRIVREAVYLAYRERRENLTREDLEKSVTLVRAGAQTGFLAPAEKPSVTFDDVFGLERAKERLGDAIEMLRNPQRLASFGERAPSGYLLAGPPGTGKTHLARAVANAADCYFFSLSAGELESKWFGESEERIRQLFSDARQYAPAVIFIDEIDAIAARRDGVHHEHSLKLLNQLLTCMDGFGDTKGQILVLAATNRPEALDPAIKRPGRFDETIPIDLPKGAAREQMLRGLLAKKPCAPNVLDAIPRLVPRTARLSPAEIDRVIREAVYLAARENRDKISIEDLETAANFVQYGADNRDIVITEDDRRRTAWHEAGHAVANHALFPKDKLDLLTIVPNEEGALGFAAYADDETRTNWSADDFRKRIIVCLAGREAERLCDGAGSDAVNTGVSSDYRQATRMAWDFVARYGFDEKFGIFSVSGVPEQIQSALADPIHARVNDLLSACLEDCRRLMEANRGCLRKLADVLLDKQFIYGEEVREIVDRHLKVVNAG